MASTKKSFKDLLDNREKTINDNTDSTLKERTDNTTLIDSMLNDMANSHNHPTPTLPTEQEHTEEQQGTRAKHTNQILRESRNKIINTRVTNSQYEKLRLDALAKDYKSISDYVYSLIKQYIE